MISLTFLKLQPIHNLTATDETLFVIIFLSVNDVYTYKDLLMD